MATRTVVCPECGAEVPSGRLSCAACGTLLASVAGAPKRSRTLGSGGSAGSGDASAPVDAVDAAAAASLSARGAAAAAWTGGMDAAEDGPVPAVLDTPAAPSATPESPPRPWTPPAWTVAQSAQEPPAPESPAPDASDSWDEGYDDAAPDARAASSPPAAEPDAEPGWPPGAAGTGVPGAYVAPGIVPAAAATIKGHPATASAIAAAAVTDGTVTSVPATARPDRWFSVPVPDPAKDGAAPGRAGLFSDLPFRTPKDAPGWATAVGSLFGAVAFLLPWSANGVAGTQGDRTYTGQWGLANPADLVPMAVAIALLLVTLVMNRTTSPIRGVILPILIGGWYLGILWSYATGPFGLGWGVDALGIGGILLVLGGALGALRAHDVPTPKAEPESA